MNRSRRPLVAGNWKMHHGGASAIPLAASCVAIAKANPGTDVLVAPPFTALAAVSAECEGSKVLVAGQTMHPKPSGAFTGEVGPTMLVESGCSWVILGHSERRQFFGETDATVAEKATAAFANKILPIVCVGESLAEREAGKTLAVVERQVAAVLDILAANVGTPAAIAYEPVWAIGTGKNAGPAEAEEVHAAIRGWLAAKSGTLGEVTRILYGGSLKPDNAVALLSCANVDGGLIGGASLDAGSFGAIAQAAEGIATKQRA